MATSRGIFLWDVTLVDERTMLLKVRISGFRALRSIARRVKCRVYIQGKYGLPFFLYRLRRRKMLVAGAFLFTILLYAMSSFVWFLEITGTERIDPDVVRQSAERHGLKVGTWKWQFDKAAAEKGIKNDLPDLMFVGIDISGTKATVEVAEKVRPDDHDSDRQPAHLVAARAGIIKEILVIAGIPKVKEGDTVYKGQILISGITGEGLIDAEPTKERPEQSKTWGPIKVRARGVVKARVWYQGYGEAVLDQVVERRTNDRVSSVGFRLGEKTVIISGPQKPPYQFYYQESRSRSFPEWRNIRLPVELFTITYTRIERIHKHLDYEQAVTEAAKQALANAQKEIPEGAQVVSRQMERVDAAGGAGVVRMKVVVETLEDIARSLPID